MTSSISVFEIIKIGIGPSSSHTMGPWKAASLFLQQLQQTAALDKVVAVKVYLYGSLAKTGVGHGTDIAVTMGLTGADYTQIDTDTIPARIAQIKNTHSLLLAGIQPIPFLYESDIVFEYQTALPLHANALQLVAYLADGTTIAQIYYSLGGGFVATDNDNSILQNAIVTPYPCHFADTILAHCAALNLRVSDLIYLNEQAWRTRDAIRSHALQIWHEIKQCVFKGINKEGILPGGLFVKRRAYDLNNRLLNGRKYQDLEEWLAILRNESRDFTKVNKWITTFALAVNEENAAFGRVVTAPTNGAAGVLPAVLLYAYCFLDDFDEEKINRFLLTAGEIGTLFKKNATISAAMGGCQAEIGVSSAMSAAALTECMGGSPAQVLMAAEIAMEHHLGMTCDPIGGLVQIPCIERNSMGAIKAITAANIALESDPAAAKVSLDSVIQSMWETALDMNTKYKETAEGGLAATIAVNVVEC